MTNTTRYSLQSVLQFDAATCTAMGALLMLASGPVARLTQISAPLLFWAGLALIPVAAFMAIFGRADRVPGWAAQLVIIGNAAWVLASLALPLAGLIQPNALGWAFLLLQAVAVAILAGLEWGAARQHHAAA